MNSILDTEDQRIVMDENDVKNLHEAKQAQILGDTYLASLQDPITPLPQLENFMRSLAKRESVLGRYSNTTALTYASIAETLRQCGETRAVVMFRSQYRIHTILYGKTHGPISGPFKDILEIKGLSADDISSIHADIVCSTKYELEGDLQRRYGDKSNAVLEYQKAARIEEISFGRDNPDLAFIWRKIACIAAIRKEIWISSFQALDFDEADLMGSRWMRQAKGLLVPGVCSRIRKGDHFFSTFMYIQAIGEYSKASAILNHQFVKKARSKQKKQAKRQIQSSSDIAHELQMLLSGEIQPLGSSSHNPHYEDRAGQIAKTDPQGARAEVNSEFDAIQKGSAEATPNKESEQNAHFQSTSISPRDAIKANVKDAIERLDRLSKASLEKEPTAKKASVLSSEASVGSAASTNSLAAFDRHKSNKKTEVKTRRKSKASRSVSSLMATSTKTLGNENLPVKPKSDSYLSKIASKTRKVASKTTKIAKRQLKRGANSMRDLSQSIHEPGGMLKKPLISDSTRTSRSTRSKGKDKKGVAHSYGAMASPPPTPLPSKVTVDTFEDQSLRSDVLSFMGGSSDENSVDRIESSTATRDVYSTQESDAQSWGTPSTFPGDNSTGNQIASDANQRVIDSTSIEAISLLGENEDSFAEKQLAADNQSIDTTDEEILERFLSLGEHAAQEIEKNLSGSQKFETSTAATPNASNTTTATPTPALLDLVSNVKTMSSLLQRQAIRLQNSLADRPTLSPDKHLRNVAQPPADDLPQGTTALQEEIHRLFKECDATLHLAFEQMKSNGDESDAMEEYRRTFTLEKAFVDELRKKVGIRVQSPTNAPATPMTPNERIGVRASFQQLNAQGRVRLGLLETPSSSDENLLSMVFEDKSTPSDR